MNQSQIPLPELQQALLTNDKLIELFGDLEHFARVFLVTAKTQRASEVPPPQLSLEEARERLLAGAERAIQIRYVYQGEEWWDTLIRTPEGVRLTRIQQTNTGRELE